MSQRLRGSPDPRFDDIRYTHKIVLWKQRTDAHDTQDYIVAYGVQIIHVIIFIVLFQVSQVIYMGCLRGAGDTAYTAMASTVSGRMGAVGEHRPGTVISPQFSLRLPVTSIKPCKNRFADVCI